MAQKEATLLIRIRKVGEDALEGISAGLAKIGQVAAGVYSAMSALVAVALKEYHAQEQAVNSMNQALVQQGIYSRQLSKDYQEMANRMQEKSAFADEEIIQAQAIMQGYLGETKITEGLMKATLDLAAAKKMDLSSAAEMVGKTVGTSTNALARQGIQMRANLNEAEKLTAVTNKLNGAFGGQAEAAVQGLGKLELLKHKISELMETLGEKATPAVEFFIEHIMKMADAIMKSRDAMHAWDSVVEVVAKGFIILENVMMTLGKTFGRVIGTMVGALSQAADGQFKMAWETIKSGAKGTADGVTESWDEMNKNLAAYDQKFLEAQQAKHDKEIELINASHARKAQIAADNTQLETDALQIKSENEVAQMLANEQAKAELMDQQRLIEAEKKKGHEQNLTTIADAENKKRLIMEGAMHKQKMQMGDAMDKFDEFMSQKKVARMSQSLHDLSRMQDSKSKELVAIAKAAAIANIVIDTARGVMGIQAWANAIPVIGPPLAMGLSAALIAYGAEQISRVNSAQMAEGGIVKARPGGMLATIGEGGRDEAVIPLDSDEARSALGGGTVIYLTVNGGLLGDRASARELAMALDAQLLELRRSKSSLAFDAGLS